MGPRHRIRTGRDQQRSKIILRWCAFLLGVAVAFMAIDGQLRTTVTTMASHEAHTYATRAINDAVIEELSASGISYSDLVLLTSNEAGDITSIQTDMMGVNRLKSQITNRVLEAVMELQMQHITVPMGTLLGNQLTSGRGPAVTFKIVPAGFAQANIYNRFESAGINQTHHQIMLDLTITVTAFVPGYTISTDVNTNICLAETVIVGAVPENFTQVEGDYGSVPGAIRDYGTGLNS